jgi:hypothetical protein
VDAGDSTHVDFAILKALLQVVVDGLVRDFADQCEIRDSDLLLLGALEDGLLCELRLGLPRAAGGVLFAPRALGNCLLRVWSVWQYAIVVAVRGESHHR